MLTAAYKKLERCKVDKSALTLASGQDTDAAEAEQESLVARSNLLGKQRDILLSGFSDEEEEPARATAGSTDQDREAASLPKTSKDPLNRQVAKPPRILQKISKAPAATLSAPPVLVPKDKASTDMDTEPVNATVRSVARSTVDIDMPPRVADLIERSQTIGRFCCNFFNVNGAPVQVKF